MLGTQQRTRQMQGGAGEEDDGMAEGDEHGGGLGEQVQGIIRCTSFHLGECGMVVETTPRRSTAEVWHSLHTDIV